MIVQSSVHPANAVLRSLWFFFALLLLLGVAPQSGHAQLPPWTRFKLNNGLEVLVVENHLTPIVTIEIAVKNGSFTESPDYNGLSHLYEHMFFTANAEDTSEDDFLSRIDDLGILYNGETHEENVQYYFTLPKENLLPGLSFMATAIMDPLFKEEELHKQREIVLGEFDRNEAIPLFGFGRKVQHALWQDYASRKDPLGQRATIRAATREQMLTIKNRYYIPNNSLLIIAGDVKTAEIQKLVPDYFERWKAGPDPFIANPPMPVPPLTENRFVSDTVDQTVANVMIRWHGPSIGIDDKATYVADVFSYIITQPDHEFTRSLQESGLTSGLNFWYYTQRYVGPIQADIQTSPDRLKPSLDVFWKELQKFDDPNYFTDEELETAKSVLRTQTLYRSEQLSTFAQDLAFWWASAGLDYYKTYLDRLSKVTRADIKEYVDRYIKNQPYVLALVMNKAGYQTSGVNARTLAEPVVQ